MFEIEIDPDKCTGDEECVNVCPGQVFEIIYEKSEPVNMEDCLRCEACIEICPEGAITIREI